jgi:hypothetical protein
LASQGKQLSGVIGLLIHGGWRHKVNLSTFDGQLLDGLDFCRKVYDLFDQVQAEPGIEELRRRSTKGAKRLNEELLPIASCVLARYRVGRLSVGSAGRSLTTPSSGHQVDWSSIAWLRESVL